MALAQALAQSPSLGLSPKPKPLAPALALAQAQSPSLGLTPKPKPLARLGLSPSLCLWPVPEEWGAIGQLGSRCEENVVDLVHRVAGMSSQLGGVSAGLFQLGRLSAGCRFRRATFQSGDVPKGLRSNRGIGLMINLDRVSPDQDTTIGVSRSCCSVES